MRIYPILFLSLLLTSACELAETNLNPNDPTDVPVKVLLPTAMEQTASLLSGEAAVIAGIFCQYFTGVDNRALTVERYLLDESFNMNPLWQDFYTGPLNVLNIIIAKATEEGAAHYAGVAKVLMALNLGTASALWGDIPYTQAFQGGLQFNPSYDAQADLYANLPLLLDQAIADLQSTSTISPADDDVIYQGDRQRWQRAAYALKARFYLHTIKRDSEAAQKALMAMDKAFQSPADDLVYIYGFTEAEQNPWFIYFRNTPYITVDSYFSGLLDELNDPRKTAYIRRSFGIDRVGDYYAGEFATVPIMTYAELKVLQAEALLRTGQTGAQAALREGVAVHLAAVAPNTSEAERSAYLDDHTTLVGSEMEQLRLVVQQLYLQHYTQVEGWTDYRRTGFPALVPNEEGANPQNPGGVIPRRFIYPQNERLFNANFPAQNPNLQDRFWWDM